MNNTVKLGLFMTAALAVLAFLIIRSEDLTLFGDGGTAYEAVFESVAGLDDKSAVRVAGVRVGRVDGIRLEGGRAVATLRLEEDVTLTKGSWARISNLGLLGDKYVELVLGPADAPRLEPGESLPGEPPPSLDAVIASLGRLGESMEEAVGDLTGDGSPTSSIGRLVSNLEMASAAIRDLVVANRENVDTTAASLADASQTLARELPRLADQLAGVLTEIRAVVGENRDSLAGSLENIERLTTDVQTTVDNLNVVTSRLADGEGTIGKLFTSDEAHDELVATMGEIKEGAAVISDSLGRVRKLELGLAMEGYYLEGLEQSRGSFKLDLGTSSGHRYRIAIVDDPRGRRKREVERLTITLPDGTEETIVSETVKLQDKFTYSALFALPIHSKVDVWAGIIESRFGLQLDYRPASAWWLALEAYDFDRVDDLDPHLRFTAGWQFHRNMYLVGGYDDFLLDEGDSFFLGGGLSWSDDDLKYLMGSLPSF